MLDTVNKLKVLIGFVPWVVFGLVSTRAGAGAVTTAALLAFFVAAAFLVAGQIRGRSPKVLEVTAAVVFAGYGGQNAEAAAPPRDCEP